MSEAIRTSARGLGFKQVDVFTSRRFHGNPVAVVLDGNALDTAQMQRIANWTNLSETTFVLRPTRAQAHYRVRIFTPRSELPFAGHPTLGTAHALIEAGLVAAADGELVQECDAGLVRITVAGGPPSPFLALQLPPASVTRLGEDQLAQVDTILGAEASREAPARLIDVGPRWIVAQLASARAVADLRPDASLLMALDRQLQATGLTVFGAHEDGHAAKFEVRSFAPSLGVAEDPVCGSGNGAVAVFVRDSGQLAQAGPVFRNTQGLRVGRNGLVQISFDADGEIWLGGQSVTCIDGLLQAESPQTPLPQA